ncbi:YhbD family protein [Dehalococcoidia bacterium]|nr:YhbD family protein [Dehalococcoidia bacterium]
MAEELISKKDVLTQTGISYGQFYRWKRKGLIPESWFIRKATFTGQEAFLPQDKILERIQRIKQLKDDHSLDEIAEFLSPEVAEGGYAREDLLQLDWLSEDLLDYYNGLREGYGPYSFIELLYLAALERLRHRDLSQGEIELALATLRGNEKELLEGERALIVARKQPHTFSLICTGHCVFDPQTEVVLRLELGQLLEEIKIKMTR